MSTRKRRRHTASADPVAPPTGRDESPPDSRSVDAPPFNDVASNRGVWPGVRQLLPHLLLAACVVLPIFRWEMNFGFDLGDEGYLWDGAQRVLRGEVPMRDFNAYDPGRYYWAAAGLWLQGNDGILALRIAGALFECLGVACGVWAICPQLTRRTLWIGATAALTLTAWMFPFCRAYDNSVSVMLVASLAWLLQQPDRRRYFGAGVVLGLAAVFGRNHGVYGLAASGFLFAWMALRAEGRRGLVRNMLTWTGGMTLGYAPILLMCLFVPGFATSFFDSIKYLFEVKATNLPLNIPWPWAEPNEYISGFSILHQQLIGWVFVALTLASCLSLWAAFAVRILGRPASPTFLAAAFLMLPYSHYAFSRADLSHLANGIFPLVLGSLWLAHRGPSSPRVLWLGIVLWLSVQVTLPARPRWAAKISEEEWVLVDVGRDRLMVNRSIGSIINLLHDFDSRLASPADSTYYAPFWPGAYPLLDRRTPAWETYPIWPRSATLEREEIARLQARPVAMALIVTTPLDKAGELAFPRTHPLTYDYFRKNYLLTIPPVAPWCEIYELQPFDPAAESAGPR